MRLWRRMVRSGLSEMKRPLPEIKDESLREEVLALLGALKAIGFKVVKIEKDRSPYRIGCLDLVLGFILFLVVMGSVV